MVAVLDTGSVWGSALTAIVPVLLNALVDRVAGAIVLLGVTAVQRIKIMVE